MKKFVFAMQVFVMSAMLPVIAFLELNHSAGNSSESISVTNGLAGIVKPRACYSNSINEKSGNKTITIATETFLVKTF